jgi:hypothetical protein
MIWRAGLLLMLLTLVGCGGTSTFTPATQTRTAQSAEQTVAALSPPTAATTRAPTPTRAPIPTVNTVVSTAIAQPWPSPPLPSTSATANLVLGSWPAFSPDVHVRFFAPPSLIPSRDPAVANRFALSGSPNNAYEALEIWRYPNQQGGASLGRWNTEVVNQQSVPMRAAFTLTSGPRPQHIGEYIGMLGQFNYQRTDTSSRVSGTMWVGQVGDDVVIVIYRCAPQREVFVDVAFEQIMRTPDFNAT